MSLTGFLDHSKEVRTLLREHFPYALKDVSFPPLKAPPLTRNFALVGQAFDYLLRFYIQRHNPHAPNKSAWVANWIKAPLAVHDNEDAQKGQRRDWERAAFPFLESAHEYHKCYLESGEVSNELLESCFNLAIMDGLVRAGEMRGTLGKVDPGDMKDLRNLLAIIPPVPFLDGTPCILNPAFPFPSGADCDLIIGNTLIEIKTTKFSEVKQEYYQQLLGYYLLNFDKSHPSPLQRIGIYFSRHGYLWSIDVNDIGGSGAFVHFLPQWNELVQNYHGKRALIRTSSHTLEELITQVNTLNGVSSYLRWLSQLSDTDLSLWKSWPNVTYFARDAIEEEEERRKGLRGRLEITHVEVE